MFVRFFPFVGVSLVDLRRSVLFGVFEFSFVALESGVSPPRFGRLLFDSLACLFLVLILDGDSSPAVSLFAGFEPKIHNKKKRKNKKFIDHNSVLHSKFNREMFIRLFVMLESLSHSLASSSVSELLSSCNNNKNGFKRCNQLKFSLKIITNNNTVAVGSGVSSFLFGGVLLARVTRIRRNEPARRRRCGRLLFAPGVFFHR